jgi:hypothetical protein
MSIDRLLELFTIIKPFIDNVYTPALENLVTEKGLCIAEHNSRLSSLKQLIEDLKKEIAYEEDYKEKLMKEFRNAIVCNSISEYNDDRTLNLVFKRSRESVTTTFSLDTFGCTKKLRKDEIETPSSLLTALKHSQRELMESVSETIKRAESVYGRYEEKIVEVNASLTSLRKELIDKLHNLESVFEEVKQQKKEICNIYEEKGKMLLPDLLRLAPTHISEAIAEKEKIFEAWNGGEGSRCSMCNRVEMLQEGGSQGFGILVHYYWCGKMKCWNCLKP